MSRIARLIRQVLTTSIQHVIPDRVAAVNLLATVPNDRLLERVAPADAEALSMARRAARFIIG